MPQFYACSESEIIWLAFAVNETSPFVSSVLQPILLVGGVGDHWCKVKVTARLQMPRSAGVTQIAGHNLHWEVYQKDQPARLYNWREKIQFF